MVQVVQVVGGLQRCILTSWLWLGRRGMAVCSGFAGGGVVTSKNAKNEIG